jgi:hypothetical protein
MQSSFIDGEEDAEQILRHALFVYSMRSPDCERVLVRKHEILTDSGGANPRLGAGHFVTTSFAAGLLDSLNLTRAAGTRSRRVDGRNGVVRTRRTTANVFSSPR